MHETPLSSSPARIGMGMLRVDPAQASHREALSLALTRGVLDFDLGFVNDPITHSRAGFLSELLATLPDSASASESSARVFLRGGLGETSAETIRQFADLFSAPIRMRVDFAYLVSDPEFALADFGGNFREFDQQLRKELELLESLAHEGALAFYGIGSAAFTYPKDDPEYLSIATVVAPEGLPRLSHLRAIELPLNLYESAAARFENQSLPTHAGKPSESLQDRTALAAAKALGLEVYTRRPFDAITETGLIRLVAYPDHHRVDLDEAVMRTLEVAMQAESDLIRVTTPSGAAQPGMDLPAPLHWAHRLRRQLTQVNDPEQWKEILRRKITPELSSLFSLLRTGKVPAPMEASFAKYEDSMAALLLSVQMWFEKAAAERNERLRSKIVEVVPSLRKDQSLAKTALRIYRSLTGVDCIFVGMRTPLYVEECLEAGELLSPTDALRALEAGEAAIQDYMKAPQKD